MQSCKICIFHPEPQPILFKVVQGERRTKGKAHGFLPLSSRAAAYLIQSSARREEDKMQSCKIGIFHPKPPLPCDSPHIGSWKS